MLEKREQRDSFIEWCSTTNVKATPEINQKLVALNSAPMTASVKVAELIRRPVWIFSLRGSVPAALRASERDRGGARAEIILAAEILIKYDGYIKEGEGKCG